MSDVLAIVADLSMPVKAGWAISLVWGIVQLGWYQRIRTAPPVSEAETAFEPATAPAEASEVQGGLFSDPPPDGGERPERRAPWEERYYAPILPATTLSSEQMPDAEVASGFHSPTA